MHTAEPFDKIPYLGPFLFEKKTPGYGSAHTVNAGNVFFSKEGAPDVNKLQLYGRASSNYKQIVDLGKPEEAVFIADTGVSECSLSPHFFDQNALIRDGDYISMHRGEELARKHAKTVTDILNPSYFEEK